ncbi:N-acetylmuramoyl-L-alanine amidase [Streptomyces rubradiris]|uniref:peptidoglycan recognition protein family protein n=1 Tax=Streptomyces rubradiris TaxID=285531 RepID=UPI0036EDCBED
MATPMTAAQVVAQLKKWGLKYVEIPGWATHNRNSKGAWGPVHGFVWHHTGVDVKDGKAYAASTLYNGLAKLPGPLCHFSIGTDGTVYLVGWGRTNHAGGGDPAVLAHVQAEDYTGQLKPTRGNSNGVDGNSRFYGVEVQYSGSHEMSAAQYAAARRLSAAILDFHGWTEKSVIGHGEWSSDKWDPGYAAGKIMPMPTVRADVKATLSAGPGKTTTPAPSKPAPSPAGLTVQAIADAVWAEPLVSPTAEPGSVATRSAGTYLRWQDQHHAEVMRKLDDLTKAIEGLASAITKS